MEVGLFEVFERGEEMEKYKVFCDGKWNEVSVLVRRSKKQKSLKVKGVEPIFVFCKGFVVVVWWGCEGFFGVRLMICGLE